MHILIIDLHDRFIICIIPCATIFPIDRICHKTGNNGIVMDVVYFLFDHLPAPEFDGLIMLLPELAVFHIAVRPTGLFKHPEQPVPSTFLVIIFDLFNDLSRCKAFKIPEQSRRIVII